MCTCWRTKGSARLGRCRQLSQLKFRLRDSCAGNYIVGCLWRGHDVCTSMPWPQPEAVMRSCMHHAHLTLLPGRQAAGLPAGLFTAASPALPGVSRVNSSGLMLISHLVARQGYGRLTVTKASRISCQNQEDHSRPMLGPEHTFHSFCGCPIQSPPTAHSQSCTD